MAVDDGASEPIPPDQAPDASPAVGAWMGMVGRRWDAFAIRLFSNLPRMALAGGIGFVVGYLTNVFVMAYRHDGYDVPAGSVASGQGNFVRGTSFWFVFSLIVSAIISHRIMVGREQFWRDVKSMPERLRRLISADGAGARAHALFGFAGATLITWALGPSLSGVLAVGLVLGLVTVLRPVITGGLFIAWRWIVNEVAPFGRSQARIESVTVATLGGASAMALAVAVPNTLARILIGLAAVVAALVMTGRLNFGTGSMLFVGGALAVLIVGDGSPVLADDGGWRECGSSFQRWLSCTGSERVLWLAAFGGGASGIGAALGTAVPGGDDEADAIPFAEDGHWYDDLEPDDALRHWYSEQGRHDRMSEYARDWRDAGHSGGADADEFQAYVRGREDLDFARINYETWRSMNPDGHPSAFYTSDFYADSARDVSIETIDAAIMIAEGPGMVRGVWQGGKWVLREGPDFVRGIPGRADDVLDWVRDRFRRSGDDVGSPTGTGAMDDVAPTGAGAVDDVVPGRGVDPDDPFGPRGTTQRPPGEEVTVRQLEHDYGYDQFTSEYLDSFARENGVLIDMKPANPASRAAIESGEALGKPELLKPKSMKPEDAALYDLPPNSEGKVAFFEPTKPADYDRLAPNDPLRLRYDLRAKQYEKYKPLMDELSLPPGQRSPEFQQAMRQQYGQDVPLQIEIRNGIVYDAHSGKPFAGDYDVWGFRDARTGEYITDQNRLNQLYDEMGMVSNPQHGPGTAHWDPTDPNQLAPGMTSEDGLRIRQELEWDHNIDNPGYESLIQFGHGGNPVTTTLGN